MRLSPFILSFMIVACFPVCGAIPCASAASSCAELYSMESDIDDANDEIAQHDKSIEEARKRSEKLENVFTDYDRESSTKLTELNNKMADAKTRRASNLREKDELVKKCNDTLDELKRGDYCSKCEKSRTQIKEELGISLEAHLAKVKAERKSAPLPVIKAAVESCKNKIAEKNKAITGSDKAIVEHETAINQIMSDVAANLADRSIQI